MTRVLVEAVLVRLVVFHRRAVHLAAVPRGIARNSDEDRSRRSNDGHNDWVPVAEINNNKAYRLCNK